MASSAALPMLRSRGVLRRGDGSSRAASCRVCCCSGREGRIEVGANGTRVSASRMSRDRNGRHERADVVKVDDESEGGWGLSRRGASLAHFGTMLSVGCTLMAGNTEESLAKQGLSFNKQPDPRNDRNLKFAFRTIPIDDYTRDEDTGLLFYDVVEGYGQPLATGETATVHFDCRFRGIDAVSSRQAQLLGGNRTIAQPAVVTVGEVPKKGKTDKGRRDELIERSGGLYTGSKGPDPPPALYLLLTGMKVGGRRLVQVEGDYGYPKGKLEIPPGGTFNMEIEVLK